MAPSVPTSLKKIKVFLARAEELDRDAARNPESRVVAYNLRQYAVQVGISLANDAESKKCLGDILSELEKEKGPMSVFNNADVIGICANARYRGGNESRRAQLCGKFRKCLWGLHSRCTP